MAGYPSNIEVVLTDKLRKYFRSALTKTNLPDGLRKEIRLYTTNQRGQGDQKARTVPYTLIKEVHAVVSTQPSQGGKRVYLHDLFGRTDIHIPELQPPERNAQLEARIQQLKTQFANKEYDDMTRNVNLTKWNTRSGSLKTEMKEMNNQLIAVFNFFLTVIGSFVFAYKATEYSMEKPNVPTQLCAGLVVATIVFFADVYFIIKNTV
ncbi:hypothetical protein LSH36_247g01005 [Paralvinella palmiformis]|uniref:Transmembrane protein 199 n=1 Tax=Paralvinella palmiformis TaxID=53620 RepID=A0AAD9N4J1_9ANNE|nr:hypothetical protein LSH36_247g01005 [Paralvinella palmiformis]